MTTPARSAIRFTLNGRSYELTRERVVESLVDVVPGQIRKHAVEVAGHWYSQAVLAAMRLRGKSLPGAASSPCLTS